MKNINLIYKNVRPSKVNILKRPIIIKIEPGRFCSDSLLYLVRKFKYLYKYKYLAYTIVLDFGEIEFADKITYLILDALLYHILKNTRFNIAINMKIKNKKIHNNGFRGTALYRVKRNKGILNKKNFIEIYEKMFYTQNDIYRRIITREQFKSNNLWPSKICTDIVSILKSYNIEEEWCDGVSEVISELICNVSSHTDGDCLIDMDICDEIKFKERNQDNKYLCINISIINFSSNRLYDRIKKNLKEKKYNENDALYGKIYKAYNNHKSFFDDKYTEDHFFLITAFQNHVTSRSYTSGCGGTGLTTLIEKIIGKTEEDYSYVLSGNNIIVFETNYLKLSKDKFVGFNSENDYVKCRPSEKVINKSKLYIPGCVYHLLLIKEC